MIQDSRFKIREFTDLEAWQQAHKLALLVHSFTKHFPRSEVFGLTSQMNRAAVSITSNIAEGFGRQGYKEKVQFHYLAQGSLTELKNQHIFAHDVEYLTSDEYERADMQICLAHRLLQGLIRKSKSFLNPES